MKPTELRIGNKLHFRYDDLEQWKVGTVSAIPMELCDDFDVGVEEAEDNCEVESIPLTQEWLKKFEFVEKHKFGSSKEWRKEDFYMYERKGNIYSGMTTTEFQVDYVHQLQNLYHSLTGKEL